eukprot:CAMPEP_0201521106 /NCGR_PEP_ID=MMETSP0161_2-20130828/14202_1 /ASSEMBLY_ACC=CAM_ASM_000251 /TAXON_ID=180227 /ORGANISM="Neoparamoeba aestuarina, Strain SoJaBio B1-5/56/2" /LENGTH=193 /DNA_ID=CAMNT_0047919681 /DNA_START=42 /DNA_END=623 /DNA_ORIENTATION=+
MGDPSQGQYYNQPPPQQYNQGPPPQYNQGPPPQYNQGPPPQQYQQQPGYYDQPPPQNYNQGPPPQYNQGPPSQHYNDTQKVPSPDGQPVQGGPPPAAPVNNGGGRAKCYNTTSNGERLWSRPTNIQCPFCQQTGFTRPEYHAGLFTWLWCCGIAFFGGILGCCLIPFCINDLKDADHFCGSCGKFVGSYKAIQ